ncbi:MarR family winged helix-turn-helix transcriptional regulator [Nocardiopsis ansamitocini]|uniref:HTH marR-type domain-containing protein n=1 Tax=Nocardiopsis ansamitocini TaxID=1670832 RepID=A0A9W6P9L8_9ACTN|nr:MarR family transcriptional regulator [Nocardiopsis ansamitocini]GLU49513.1 hypothetical protein Nans01_38640 [Nocardiopsis ansamitocini]
MDRQPTPTETITALEQIAETLIGLWRTTREQVAPSISEQQMRVLTALERSDTNLSSLAEVLGLPPSSATRLCDRLERHGLLERRPAGRRVIVFLTPAGRTLLTSIHGYRRRRLEQAWNLIPAADRSVLAGLLPRIALPAPSSEVDPLREQHPAGLAAGDLSPVEEPLA